MILTLHPKRFLAVFVLFAMMISVLTVPTLQVSAETISGILTFSGSGKVNIGQIANDGVAVNEITCTDISGIQLDIFNTNETVYSQNPEVTGSLLYMDEWYSATTIGGIFPLTPTTGVEDGGNPPEILVIKSHDGNEFSFLSIYLSDTLGNESFVKFEGFRDGKSTGHVILTSYGGDPVPTYTSANGLDPKIFQNVDEIRMTNQVGGDRAYGNYGGINNIVIGDPVVISSDATLKASSTVKGQAVSLGTPNASLGSETAGAVTITTTQASNTSNTEGFITLFDKTESHATVKVVKYASGAPTGNFESDAAYANQAISDGDFFVIKVTAQDETTVMYYRVNVTVTVEGAYTAEAGADAPAPVVGVDDEITLTVKNSLGNTDTDFNGAKNVTIKGVEAAPDGTYGSFNGTALDASAAGGGQVISVPFTNGVAKANLKLNKAQIQTIGFSIATVITPATNTLIITPLHGTAVSMAVTQDVSAPASNGGTFAQQPKITIKDAYGNTCTSDYTTVVTADKEDAGAWTLTGTKTVTASAGVAIFTNLGATNAALVNNAQLGFTSGTMAKVGSNTVTLPAPAGSHTAVAAADTLTPAVGVDNEITLTVRNSIGNTDTDFNGAKNVTIKGVEAAPDGSYGSFNGIALTADSAGAGQVISVPFANGVATANLKLNKADGQTIGFSIATVTSPSTNTLTITPTHGAAVSMAVTQDVTAPAGNGGSFAQQPVIAIKDAYGNTCTSDNTTVVTADKEDAGVWTLTGIKTATAISGVATFTNLGATNAGLVNNAQLGFTSGTMAKVTSSTVTLPAPAGNHTAGASADTLAPVVGADDEITLTVRNSLGNTDTDFNGAKNVTIKGVEAAPDGTYGSFNGTALTADSAGAGQVISVPFANGVATANLKLNKADGQTIGFSIATVTSPETNTLTITPTHGAAVSMAVTQDITAPAVNGGSFAQQPKIAIKDAYGNICTSDNTTVVTADKEDAGAWTLTGTKTATAISGVATFANLGATNAALVNNAQLGFTSGTMAKVTSGVVTLPAPAGSHTAGASADTLAPVVGADDEITLTVRNSLGNTDTDFNGAKNVTIKGVEAAPDGTYGSFNGTALTADSAGGGQVISVTFTNGVATANLKLNKADGQTIGFSIATVASTATNTLTITPTHGAAVSMAVTQNVTAPASNGGTFAQQPKITINDAYGNTCTSDNTTVVTADKEDAGAWTLTGTKTATASAGVATFTNLGATNAALVNNAQLGFTSGTMTKVTSGKVTLPAPAGSHTAEASAGTLAPVVGADDEITLTVRNSLGNIDTSFNGARNVTIKGVEAAPNGTYGSFNGTALDASAAGGGQVISVSFANGVATANLKLNKADGQTIGFSIATVASTATNTLTITPTHGTAASMAVTQNVTAPASNGGTFAQQPKITIKDACGNICKGDNTSVVTAAREDAGAWTLTGTKTATASAGVAAFANLGATNTALVNNAQLGFTSGTMTKVTSGKVTLPAASSNGTSGSGGGTVAPPSPTTVLVIVNGKEQDAGTETKTTEDGKTTVTVQVNNTVIGSKIDEAVKNNTTRTGNIIQVLVTDTKSEVAKVELTGDIVKKLEENKFDVSVKRDNVEYVIPAEEFTIGKVAENLGVSEKDLDDIKVEVKFTKPDEKVIEKYSKVAKANGAELVFPPISFIVSAKTTKLDGVTKEVEISKFSNFVERVMEIPVGVDPGKITTGIVFNPDGTYSHVPTEVFQKDGKWYAKLNSLTNSEYSVIWNPVTVKSVENHWAKDAVNDMASRLVIFNHESFAPDKAITRADFAEYIVRALGLYREDPKHMNKFKDVSETGDRSLAILIASEYGIVDGYSDGTFRPNVLITREEAMTMYQRAMKITKLNGNDPNRYKTYADFAKVSTWAANSVKEVLSAHVFNGTSETNISPKASLTYAEAAQAIKNLLVESKLINK